MANLVRGSRYTLTPDIPTGNPATVNDATAKNPLGILYVYNGNTYRYVKFDNGVGNVAAIAKGAVHWKSLDPSAGTYTVTSDQTDALGSLNSVAGVILGVVTDLYFCWIQVAGTIAAAKVVASAAVGDAIIGSTTDLTFGKISASTAAATITGTRAHHYGAVLVASTTSATGTILLDRGLDW